MKMLSSREYYFFEGPPGLSQSEVTFHHHQLSIDDSQILTFWNTLFVPLATFDAIF